MLLTPDGVPRSLVRTFREEAHFRQFLAGEIRLGRLDVYRSIEDPTRRDDMEGEARLIVPGEGGTDVNYGGSFHNPVYLLCCSEPSVAVNPSLGAWTARINKPEDLLSALCRAAAVSVPDRELMHAMLLQVRYSKEFRVPFTPPSEERYHLMLAQKPARFEAEREWRYALVFSGGVGDSPTELWLRIENIGQVASTTGLPHRENMIDLGFAPIYEAVELCLAQRWQLPALMLIYAAIDIAGWWSSERKQGVKASFTAFADRYMLNGSSMLASSMDLYAARCAVLHTYTSQSDLNSQGKARVVGYAWGDADVRDLQTSFDRMGEGDMVAVHINELFAALRRGVEQLSADISADPLRCQAVLKRMGKRCGDLPKSVLESFLKATNVVDSVVLRPGPPRIA